MSLSGLDVSPVFLHHSLLATTLASQGLHVYPSPEAEHVIDWQSLKNFASADISEVSWRHLSEELLFCSQFVSDTLLLYYLGLRVTTIDLVFLCLE